MRAFAASSVSQPVNFANGIAQSRPRAMGAGGPFGGASQPFLEGFFFFFLPQIVFLEQRFFRLLANQDCSKGGALAWSCKLTAT